MVRVSQITLEPVEAPPGGGRALAEPEVAAELPPTLRPGAIFQAAPPRRPALSILITVLVYGLIGLSVQAWVRYRGAVARSAFPIPPQAVTLTLEESPDPPPSIPHLALQGPAPAETTAEGAGTPDPRLLAMDPILPMDAIPRDVEEIPTTLPRETRVVADPSLPVAVGGNGLAAGQGHGGGHGSGRGAGVGMIRGVPGMNPGLDLNDLEVIHEEIPDYPTLAAWSNIQGDVVVRVTIDEHGVPIRTELLEGPPQLCGVTMRAVKHWRFGKGIFRGKKVNAVFDMTFRFILRPR